MLIEDRFLKRRLALIRIKILFHICILPSCLLLRVTFCANISVSQNKGLTILCKLELHVLREENLIYQMDIVIDILTKSVGKRTNFKTLFTKYTKYRLQLINIDGSSF